jgi:hypothetical protein
MRGVCVSITIHKVGFLNGRSYLCPEGGSMLFTAREPFDKTGHLTHRETYINTHAHDSNAKGYTKLLYWVYV